MSVKHFVAACAIGLATSAVGLAEEKAEITGLDAALQGFERTGEMRSCLNTRTIRSIDRFDDSHWRVETRGGDVYLNVVRGACDGASSSFTALQYSTPTGQLCSGEIVRVIDTSSRFVRGACSLGEYEALTPIE